MAAFCLARRAQAWQRQGPGGRRTAPGGRRAAWPWTRGAGLAEVQVFERSGRGFERIAQFGSGGPTVNVVYSGRCHYDAFEPR